MKRVTILLALGVFLAVSCEKQESQVSNVSFTPCQQSILRSNSLSDKVNVEFTSEGVQITHYNFEVTCDFTTVRVTHTFVNGVLNITQQGAPNQANCICYTDVSYTINGMSQDEVNVIFINGEQVYCYNDKDDEGTIRLKLGEITDIKVGETAVNSQYGLSLRVENVNDGRCPLNACCEWAGLAYVQFSLTTPKGKYEFTLDVNISVNTVLNNTIAVEDLRILLFDVFPYPVGGEEQPVKTARVVVFEEETAGDCDYDVIIGATEYETAPNYPVFIENMKIEGNCLKIKFSASGCDGNSWVVKLIDMGVVAESNPCQRILRLSLDNREMCAAVIGKEVSFNIEDLQIYGNKRVSLNVSDNWILYEY